MGDLLTPPSSSNDTEPTQAAASETTLISGQVNVTEALKKFHLFPKLAPELRELIWKQALPRGHHGKHMVLLRLDMDYMKSGRKL